MKPKYKRRLLWTFISVFGAIAFSVIIVPPMINLNSLKPRITEFIYNQTGIHAIIHGNVNFSLLNNATIIAHNVIVPNGVISSCEFKIPVKDIFDIKNAKISGDIIINGGNFNIEKIVPFDLDANIVVNNSKFNFLDKQYDIVYADLSRNSLNAIVRTNQHKYEITAKDNNFIIKNHNNDLNLTGTLLNDGSVVADLSITAQNINRWFEFENPKITGHFPITANMHWDGQYGVEFKNISANGMIGDISWLDNGYKIIKLKSDSANYDLSFILQDIDFLKNASLNLDLYGKIKFLDKTFRHVYVNVIGSETKIKIQEIIADDLHIIGGTIDGNGAHNLNISLPENGVQTTCIFSGTPSDFTCSDFSYGNKIFGDLSVKDNVYELDVRSNENLVSTNNLINSANHFGKTGEIRFNFANAAGIIKTTKKSTDIKYDFINNKSLNDMDIDLSFLPDFMRDANGDFTWQNHTMSFIPKFQNWHLIKIQDKFVITGQNFKDLFPDVNLESISNLSYLISGNYRNGNISNLVLEIANHKFTGTATKNSITLKSDILNLDSFISPEFVDNFESLSFFTQLPIMIPFNINKNVALSAKALIYNGQKYNNFIYSLHENIQNFSVSDSNRGNILTAIGKNKHNYNINIQLNKFVWDGKILPANMPMNLGDTTITAEIKLTTNGKIAHDIIENINGDFDMTFDGGMLYGLGINDFYASYKDITKLNSEYALIKALDGGETPIKKMRFIGTYKNGDIQTTTPMTISMKHSDATGTMDISNKDMVMKLNLVLRGTSPEPETIEMTINPDNTRQYSLSDIILNFDPEYMRTFIETHDKF